ncbi:MULTISPECIES: phosphotransacetylase family protein [unclassified Coleofasciculus]|uniref:phosphotransacetylase family protein n=1 Tax=unclassified Coleofasciculus TaxID=2692782 RepID=UPI00188253A8|nr:MULTISPECIES: phosphotransacetylase family protein [unclassified Coleofasciculus]MBE9125687.1 phosphotransacetylase family protein [Coleofasciculus sp. LEGE 07081]MBE9148298.1 phosphotransacetylase family protein [Coleofasciculus sp. LEGE 07092]
MAKSAKYLLVGSTEAYSGKSATILGIAHQLQEKGIDISYGKLLGTYRQGRQPEAEEEDIGFMTKALNLPSNRVCFPLLSLNTETIQKRLSKKNSTRYRQELKTYLQSPSSDMMLIEGPGTLWEGSLFDLSLLDIADEIDAAVLLVARFHPVLLADALLSAKQQLGDRLLGVLINAIPPNQQSIAQSTVQPFLEEQGIPVLGMLPTSDLLRSVSVRELVRQLQAEVLCRSNRLDLMVEGLTIGAMNVNSALKYFRKGRNMAVVTGGDRTDIQMAALETSTHCLILTGHLPPQPIILNRAEELEIPVLSVDLDTLTTVEIIDRAFGQVRLHEPIKVQYLQKLMVEHFDIERLMNQLGLEPAVSTH